MSNRILHRLRRFRGDERGTAAVEFAIMLPIYLTLFLSAVEMGMMTLRQTMMERGVDLAVRDLRIGTDTALQHDELRDLICEYAGILPDCSNALQLELRSMNLRTTGLNLASQADCVDRSEPVNPVLAFTPGARNEMMVMRACLKMSPIFPNIGLGAKTPKDGNGDLRLIATTAFVNEPV